MKAKFSQSLKPGDLFQIFVRLSTVVGVSVGWTRGCLIVRAYFMHCPWLQTLRFLCVLSISISSFEDCFFKFMPSNFEVFNKFPVPPTIVPRACEFSFFS